MQRLAQGVWIVALAKLALHLATSARGYGYFGDELYYLACASHPAFGYVDHPPFSIWLLGVWRAVFGDSLVALRLLPALLGSASAVLAGLLARELGARAAAQTLTALVVALAPVNLVVQGFYSMNAIDIVVWLAASIAIVRVLDEPRTSRWVGLGLLLGVGLLDKISVLWLGAGLAVALILTPHRHLLRTPGPWIAGALAGLLFLPHVVWQVAHGWPTLEFVRVATTQKMVPVPPLELFAQQVLVWHPLTFPLWLAGAIALMRRPRDDPGRVLALIFAVTAGILIWNGTSRPNYLALAMPPLVAAGAIALERRWPARWPMRAAIASVAVLGLLGSPLSLPILPPEQQIAFKAGIGLGAPKMERREVGGLDPHFADMFGWDAIVDGVAEVYAGLPAEDRARAGLMAVSYSEAGALELLGPERGLPPPISPHNNYWHWGTGAADGSVMVIAGGPRELWAPHWAVLEEVAEWDCGYCLPGRNHGKVYVAREPRAPIDEIWEALRRYD